MKTKLFSLVLSLMVLTSLVLGGGIKASAMPSSPTDMSKVPHYFGPYPNWANSPLTYPDATVTINGDGAGATAAATVGANGTLTGITITNPGSGYTSASITISGAGTGATADAVVTASGTITAVNLVAQGGGYISPVVTISGGGATTDATAIAYGGVDAVTVIVPGSGYTMPTVDFDLPDAPDGVQARAHAVFDSLTGEITGIVVDEPGSGYSTAPKVVIRDGTLFDPINGGTGAEVAATLSVTQVALDTYGAGYTFAPVVSFGDLIGAGTGASATAVTDYGTVTAISLTNGGSGYVTSNGIKKFVDALPGLCLPPACPTTGKYIPLAVSNAKDYNGVIADEFVVGLVQYRTNFSSSLPDTLVRGYVQIETTANAGVSQHFALYNEMMDGTRVPVLINGQQAYSVTPPQYLGPTILATKDRPVRIVFYNLLPTGAGGDLFLPVDATMMGSGEANTDIMPMNDGTVMDDVRNPACAESPKPIDCFKDNRATLHLHGGLSPWISDGTPHQWITPAGEQTNWPQGVSVQNVPDMNVCNSATDGCQTFYYTNQQSARLMFYHDHAWGITRLNVYAGEAAGYLISDNTEQALISSGTIPADQIPLIVQDKTFVPDAAQLALQDPTWDTARWGTKGSFWYHHVYMPAQNPGDPSGMSAYGRWMYGPWFWPPAANTVYGPIANPYYDPNCNLDNPATWQYQTDPFCEPAQIPGTPNISAGMEQFNDTPIVNGVAYPTITLEPKSYRFRILSAANDRFFNFQWYVADPSTASTGLNSLGQVIGGTEVALNPAELEAAQLDPNVFPTPVQGAATAGPDWIQIGTEGGFLPAPTVIDGQQPTTWITDPTRFDVGNVDKHSLLLAPAERADVIVDFSKFAGKTLILYNDAPAAFPARVSTYDYYTGAPDLSPNGAPTILPGYGPNTRTIMQVKIAPLAPATTFNLTKLQTAFRHNASGTGVFESGQPPIIVGQAAYNTAYGTNFAASSNCNVAGSTLTRCDGLVRINDTMQFGFNTLRAQTTKMIMPLQPKAIHDEMNSTTFDEFGRMQANLGVEAQPPSPGAQNVTLYPYVNPSTELIDGTNLPKGDINLTAISTAADGSQIWRITHNGVDTHPIHFHLFDVQLLNRVTWDNIIIPPDPNELGWKDTVRVAPLEDTIVALRPIIPQVPFEIPNAIRPLNPMKPIGSISMFNNVDPQGNPTNPITNQLVNFGWEYVYHCHILSHEEMDMMRPVTLALPPIKPDGLAYTVSGNGNTRTLTLTWNDNSITETAFVVQKSTDAGATWIDLVTIQSPLNQPNTHGVRSIIDNALNVNQSNQYRIVAQNTVGYGAEFPSMTVQSVSAAKVVDAFPPAAPSALSATAVNTTRIDLAWTDNASNETGFTIERALVTNGVAGAFTAIDGVGANITTYTDPTVSPNTRYAYRIFAYNTAGNSPYSNVAMATTPAPGPTAPSNLTATLAFNPTRAQLSWRDNSNNENLFQVWRATNNGTATMIGTVTRSNNQRTSTGGTVTFTNANLASGNTYTYYVIAVNTVPNPDTFSVPSNTASVTVPTAPAAPSNLRVTGVTQTSVSLAWNDNANNETGFEIQYRLGGANWVTVATLPANTTVYTNTGWSPNYTIQYRVRAINSGVTSPWSNTVTAITLP